MMDHSTYTYLPTLPTYLHTYIHTYLFQFCGSDSTVFMGAGREDIDVRMLGNGRPFLLQVGRYELEVDSSRWRRAMDVVKRESLDHPFPFLICLPPCLALPLSLIYIYIGQWPPSSCGHSWTTPISPRGHQCQDGTQCRWGCPSGAIGSDGEIQGR